MFSPKDRETRKPRGFTFCQYRRKEDAADAVKGMDKRVGFLAQDFRPAPLWWGWTGGMFCCSVISVCLHTLDTPKLCLDISDFSDLWWGVEMSSPSLWGCSSLVMSCLVLNSVEVIPVEGERELGLP